MLELSQELVEESVPGTPMQGNAFRVLGICLLTQYRYNGDAQLLDKALTLHRDALRLQPPGCQDHAAVCASLAIVLSTKYDRTGMIEYITEEMEVTRATVEFHSSTSHPFLRASALSIMSATLIRYYRHIGDVALVDQAIDFASEACQLAPHMNISYMTNHAIALMAKARHIQDNHIYSLAAKLFQRVIDQCPANHSYRPLCFKNMSACLYQQYQVSHDLSYLDKATEMVQPASEEASQDSRAHLNLPLILLQVETARYHHHIVFARGDDSHAQRILDLCDEAIELTSNPQEVFRIHLTRTRIYSMPTQISNLSNVNKATEELNLCLNIEQFYYRELLAGVVECLEFIWEIYHSDIRILAKLYPAYLRLHELTPLMSLLSLDNSKRLDALAKFQRIGTYAFISAKAADQPLMGLELLEHAQGMLWSQALQIRDPQTQKLPSSLGSELHDLLRSLDASPADHQPPSRLDNSSLVNPLDHLRHRNAIRISQLIKQIRTIPGYERFLLGISQEEMRSVGSDQHPVVIVVQGELMDHFAIILRSRQRDVDVVSLTFDMKAMLNRTSQGFGSLSGLNRDSTGQETDSDQRGIRTSLPLVNPLSHLWRAIVEPVLQHLGMLQVRVHHRRPRIHWLPTGSFTFLPIHAAGIYDGPQTSQRCCSDYVVSSYIPTLSALIRARNSFTLHELTHGQAFKLLLAADAHGGHAEGLSSINNVDIELFKILQATSGRALEVISHCTGHATVENIERDITTAHVVHLACHGVQDPVNPLESGFYFGNEKMTISRLMNLKLEHPFMAYLSACQTATGDKTQPNQAMHLTSAMLFTGFANVVGTMWNLNDQDGPMVAESLYKAFLASEHVSADTIAVALDGAVKRLRENGVAPARWAAFVHFGV